MVTTRNKFTEFFDTHRVFNTDEFQKHCAVTGYHARNTLVKYTQSRHIRKLRNKLYTVLPEGSPDSFMPSPLGYYLETILISSRTTSALHQPPAAHFPKQYYS